MKRKITAQQPKISDFFHTKTKKDEEVKKEGTDEVVVKLDQLIVKTNSTNDNENIKLEDKVESETTKEENKFIHPMFNKSQQPKLEKKLEPGQPLSSLLEKPKPITPPESDTKFESNNLAELMYTDLCETFDKIENTPKRLEKTSILKTFFLKLLNKFDSDPSQPEQLWISIYLCLNKVGPEYEGLELGLGESLLIKAVLSASSLTNDKLKKEMQKLGDLGRVAQENMGGQIALHKPKPLSLNKVFHNLKTIAMTKGNSSQKFKVDTIRKMLIACSGTEVRFLIRSLEGKLRIGLAEQTVLSALAHSVLEYQSAKGSKKKMSKDALEEKSKEAVEIIKTAYSELPNYELIVPNLLQHGIDQLELHCKLTPGIPVKPMLAHPTKSIVDVLDRFEKVKFTCEYKYDGERVQLHRLADGSTRIYSRNLEEMTAKYPDLIATIPQFINSEVKSFVLDCEAVAWDSINHQLLPFQVLSTRKRKDVQEADIKVKVVLFAFDLLYLNEQPLLRTSLSKRRELLSQNFKEVDGVFCFAKSEICDQTEEIQQFLDQSIIDNCEGLMVKLLEGEESSYEPSRRSRNWLKVKKDYLDQLGDSLDLVVLGAYYGTGKRTGTYGKYLLGCYDPQMEQFQATCKIGTGFSEKDLSEHFANFKDLVIAQPRTDYLLPDTKILPNVWFKPEIVFEVKAADFSLSPIYRASYGSVESGKGISLRFPRFIRLREDKKGEMATDCNQLTQMYKDQQIISNQQNTSKKNKFADDDFEY